MAHGRDGSASGETLRVRGRSSVHKRVVVRENIAAAEKSRGIVVDTFEIQVASDTLWLPVTSDKFEMG
jgi:hypothetical protein